MLGDIAVGRLHVAGHDARDGLLAEVVEEEGIDGLGCVRGIGICRCRGDVELHGALAVGDGDIVDAEPGPAGCDLNRIVALIHEVGTGNGLAWSFLRRVEGGSVAIDRQIDHLVAIQSVIADGDGVFAAFGSRIGKGDLGIALRQFEGFAFRILPIFDEFAILVGSAFGFHLSSCLGSSRDESAYRQHQ